MNFVDAYDLTNAPSTPPPSEGQQSLNEEVNEVIGQLGRFWGGFRKQSATVLESAKKDLGSVVEQAQKELKRLNVPAEGPSSQTQTQEDSVNEKAASEDRSAATSSTEGGPSTAGDNDAFPSPAESVETLAPSPAQTFFSRLQSSIPPNLVSTVQSQIPASLISAPSAVDFSQIRASLSTEFQRVQGITRVQAEEYVHMSEQLFKEAAEGAREMLKDAVKIVPPEESGETTPGVIWDGSDIWMAPSIVEASGSGVKGSGKGKGKERGEAGLGEAQRAVATRKEAMLRALRRNPEVIRADPEVDTGAKEMYAEWDRTEGGIQGAEWEKAAEGALKDEIDGEALKATRDVLVPSEMTNEVFWTRYFFRVHQIEREEERRKALLQGSIQNEEDFSWEEDEEDESATTSAAATISGATRPESTSPSSQAIADPEKLSAGDKVSAPTSRVGTPGTSSPVHSSESSFDVLSSNVSVSGEDRKEDKDKEEEGDSDWE